MKKKLGVVNCLYPMPTVLVGATVNGKPNFITIAHVGIVTINAISISSHKDHYTNAGIKANGTFSINIPAEELVKGNRLLRPGERPGQGQGIPVRNVLGVLKTAPMIAGCPICMEVKLLHALDFKTHELFVGEIVETYADESVLTSGVVELQQGQADAVRHAQPAVLALGAPFAKCWEIGKSLKV